VLAERPWVGWDVHARSVVACAIASSARSIDPGAPVHHGGAVAQRTRTSRAVTVGELAPATAAAVREQAAVHGLGDPLPEVTHALRCDEEKTTKRLFGGPRTTRHTVEALLTPELLIVADRDGDEADAQVGLHRLDQLDFAAVAAELLARATGTAVAVPDGLMPMTSTPVGSTRRATRYVPVGTGPDVARFREALTAAVERTRHGAGT
jgi:hypothetical protein